MKRDFISLLPQEVHPTGARPLAPPQWSTSDTGNRHAVPSITATTPLIALTLILIPRPPPPHAFNMPSQLALQILGYLDARSLLACGAVCRGWRYLADKDKLVRLARCAWVRRMSAGGWDGQWAQCPVVSLCSCTSFIRLWRRHSPNLDGFPETLSSSLHRYAEMGSRLTWKSVGVLRPLGCLQRRAGADG